MGTNVCVYCLCCGNMVNVTNSDKPMVSSISASRTGTGVITGTTASVNHDELHKGLGVLPPDSRQNEMSKGKDSIPIKVINPLKKRESKTYMLNIHISTIGTLKHLREEILEQLGKDVVSFNLTFDVGYFVASSRKICFVDADNIKTELIRVRDSGKSLWCQGRSLSSKETICIDGDDEFTLLPKKAKVDENVLNACEAKAKKVGDVADKLKGIHKEEYNKVQYKLWAEAIVSGKHTSESDPPTGTIWNKGKAKTKSSPVDSMATAFTKMADSVSSAFTKSTSAASESNKESPEGSSSVGISPGKRIDYQAKLLHQIDLSHKMFERGAITTEQFEKRRDMLLSQLDNLSQ